MSEPEQTREEGPRKAPKENTSIRLSAEERATLERLAPRLGGGKVNKIVARAIRLLAHADDVLGLAEHEPDDEILALDAWARGLDLAEAELGFSAPEWALIADVCNGATWNAEWSRPGVLLAANVEDGHRLSGAGYRWLGSEGADLAGSLHCVGVGGRTEEMSAVDAAVADLVRRLAALDYVHGWAVIRAVRWFWAHCEMSIDVREERWWTAQYRRRRLAPKEGGNG